MEGKKSVSNTDCGETDNSQMQEMKIEQTHTYKHTHTQTHTKYT